MYVGWPRWFLKVPPKLVLPRFLVDTPLKINLRKPRGGEDQKD